MAYYGVGPSPCTGFGPPDPHTGPSGEAFRVSGPCAGSAPRGDLPTLPPYRVALSEAQLELVRANRHRALLKKQSRQVARAGVTTTWVPSSPDPVDPVAGECSEQTTDVRRKFAFGRVTAANARAATAQRATFPDT